MKKYFTLVVRRAIRPASVVLAAGLLGPQATAQPPLQRIAPPDLAHSIHEVWTTDNGLPQNAVYDIVQTEDGYLWLATQEGIARFDGAEFVIFDKRTTPEIRNNDIWVLLESRDHALWAGTNSGLLRLKDGRWTRFSTADGLSDDIVRSLYEDRNGTIWAGTNRGLNQIRDGTIQPFSQQGVFRDDVVRAICEDSDRRLWIGTDGDGLRCIDDGLVRSYSARDGLASNFIFSLAADTSGAVWIATEDRGVAVYSRGRFTPIPPGPNTTGPIVYRVVRDRRGSIWFCTSESLTLLTHDHPPYTFKSYTTDDGISRKTVYSFLEDREGSIWVGTFAGGLNRFFEGSFKTIGPPEGLSDDFAYCVRQSGSGAILVGTENGGMDEIRNGIARPYRVQGKALREGVYAIFEAPDGDLWLGTFGAGLGHVHRGLLRFITQADGLSDNFVRSIVQDRWGDLWVGTRNGLNELSHGRWRVYRMQDGLPNNFIRSMTVDSHGDLWIGTFGGGLSRYSNGRFTTFDSRNGLSSDDVRCIREDSAGVLWVGTDGGGVNRLERGSFVPITTSKGLYDDVILAIVPDGNGRFWMSCNKGIFSVPRQELCDCADGRIPAVHSTVYGKEDGMRSQECNAGQPAGWESADGKLWFPTIKGVVVLNPERLVHIDDAPRVIIESIWGDAGGTVENGRMMLNPGTDRIEVRYTAPTFVAPDRVRFRYRAVGLDAKWVESGSRRIAFYTNPPPGSYTFVVTTENADGLSSAPRASAEFVVQPFFYETRSFLAVSAVLLALLGYGLYELRVRQLKQNAERLRTLVHERTMDLQRQSAIAQEANAFKSTLLSVVAHDLKSPLISIRGFVQLLLEEVSSLPETFEKADIINRLSQNAIELINTLLESAALESGTINLTLKPVDLCALTSSVVDFNRIYARQKHQKIESHLEPPGSCIVEADAGRLSEAMDNLLSNAMKFSDPGKTIWVEVRRLARSVEFSVRDEGPGLPNEERQLLFQRFAKLSSRPTAGEPSTGLGLAIVKQLVELHHGSVRAENVEAGGTTFIIELPLGDRQHAPT